MPLKRFLKKVSKKIVSRRKKSVSVSKVIKISPGKRIIKKPISKPVKRQLPKGSRKTLPSIRKVGKLKKQMKRSPIRSGFKSQTSPKPGSSLPAQQIFREPQNSLQQQPIKGIPTPEQPRIRPREDIGRQLGIGRIAERRRQREGRRIGVRGEPIGKPKPS